MSEIGTKRCWICYRDEGEDDESALGPWITPCQCKGSVGFVHQDCLIKWVRYGAEQQSPDWNVCPQCKTPYKMRSRIYNRFAVMIVNTIDGLAKKLVIPLSVAGVLSGSLCLSLWWWGEFYCRAMVENQPLWKDAIPPELSLRRVAVVAMIPLSSVTFSSWFVPNSLAVSVSLESPKNSEVIGSMMVLELGYQVFYNGVVRVMELIWNEKLESIQEYEKDNPQFRQNGLSVLLSKISAAILLPLCASLIADRFFSKVLKGEAIVRRTIIGFGLLAVKDTYSLYRRFLRKFVNQRTEILSV